MHHRLAACDRDHRSAAFLDRGDRLLDRHPLTQHVVRLLDLAAAVALEIAGEQRFELDDERELLAAADLVREQVPADSHFLAHWYGHQPVTPLGRLNFWSSRAITRSSTSTGPSARSTPTNSSTRCGGAEAPAVIPMVSACSSQSGSTRVASSTR